jgi:hypothetical protein
VRRRSGGNERPDPKVLPVVRRGPAELIAELAMMRGIAPDVALDLAQATLVAFRQSDMVILGPERRQQW